MLPWSENDTSVTDDFIDEMVKILKTFVHETYDRTSKVIDFKTPDEILKEVDLEIKEHSSDLPELIDVTKKVLDLSVKTGIFINYNRFALHVTQVIGLFLSLVSFLFLLYHTLLQSFLRSH